jgi:hypothetical protein
MSGVVLLVATLRHPLCPLLLLDSVHFVDSADASFGFVKTSMMHSAVERPLDKQLSNFLMYITSSSQVVEFAAPTVVSGCTKSVAMAVGICEVNPTVCLEDFKRSNYSVGRCMK